MTRHDPEALRSMVREVLREVLPRSGEPGPSAAGPGVRRVRVRDDRDLDALVGQVLDLAEDPDRLADLRAGRLRFALEHTDRTDSPEPETATPLDVERGAVTERLVHRAAREQRSLRIGPRAVITPLARDRARALGVSIERTTVSSVQRREPR